MNEKNTDTTNGSSYHQQAKFDPRSLSTAPALATYYLTLVYIMSIPWENAVKISGIGTLSKSLGLLLAALWVLTVVTKGSFGKINDVQKWCFLFIFWCALTTLWAPDQANYLIQLRTYSQLFISLCIVITVVNTPARSITALQAYALGCWIVAIFVMYNYQAGNVTKWTQRASIVGVDENDIALVLSTGIPIAWFLATRVTSSSKNKLLIIFNFLLVPVGLIAIIMTGSRGGFASLFPAVVYILLSLKNFNLKSGLFTSIALIVAIIFVIIYVPETPFARITTTIDEVSSQNVSGRWDIWAGGIALWLENGFNTYFGIGIGGYYAELKRTAHSTPISVLVETGVVGITLFMFIIVSLFSQALKAHRSVTWLCIAVLGVWLIGISALSWDYRKPTWVLWSLTACLAYTHTYRPTVKTITHRRW